MRYWAMGVGLAGMLMAGQIRAQEAAGQWQALDGSALRAALTSRVLAYDDGALQDFKADGSTLYDSGTPSRGSWRVQGAQYCSVWPPSDRWTCYDVARSAGGLGIRFTAGDGSVSEGRYTDLQ